MIKRTIDHMDLEQIASSGQCFRWLKLSEDTYSIIHGNYGIEISQAGDEFTISCGEKEWETIWEPYFDMQTDYTEVERRIAKKDDAHLQEAFEGGKGIRILNQDLWEMIVTFMISQNNNIGRITKSVEELCNRCKKPLEFASHLNESGEQSRYRFPLPGEVDEAVFDDKTMGFGYRSEYLRQIYKYGLENPLWLEDLKKMTYDEAMESLLARKGIGKKVANCICLFGLHHIDAFPIDTHVKQLLDKYYADGFDFKYFSGIAGIIQQYLFYYELVNK